MALVEPDVEVSSRHQEVLKTHQDRSITFGPRSEFDLSFLSIDFNEILFPIQSVCKGRRVSLTDRAVIGREGFDRRISCYFTVTFMHKANANSCLRCPVDSHLRLRHRAWGSSKLKSILRDAAAASFQ